MSQITIDGTTLNFKDSAFTGDQWESVADWVLNGGGEESKDYANLSKSYAVGSSGVREGENTDNAKYYKEQTAALNTAAQSSADAAATSAATAAENKTAAAGSAAEAATSAATAGKKASVAAENATAAEDSKTASEASARAAAASEAAAAGSASAAAGSATAALASETNAAAAASKAENASNHPPRIGESGYWELWDFDNGKYVTTTYPAQGPQGEQGIQGPQGEAGESAYTAASKGGYTGTETQFNSDLAKIGNKADKTVPAAVGNLAALDAAGNLSDSGKKVGDFQSKVTASGLLKGDGAGGVTAAAAGADYSGPKATVTATLLASGWTDSEAPFVYTLAIAGVTATSYQELVPAVNITAEQLKALQAANITDAGQAAGSMTLKAYGKKPTVDIPIRVIKEGE